MMVVVRPYRHCLSVRGPAGPVGLYGLCPVHLPGKLFHPSTVQLKEACVATSIHGCEADAARVKKLFRRPFRPVRASAAALPVRAVLLPPQLVPLVRLESK